MTHLKFLCFITLCVSFMTGLSCQAHAAQVSGDYLHKICAVDSAGRERVPGGQAVCQSYIAGIIDYHNMLRSMDLTSDMNFCIPKEATLNDIQRRVVYYLDKNLKLHRNFVAAPAVAMALFSFYPCKS